MADRSVRIEFNDLHHRPKYHVPVSDMFAKVEFVKPMRNAEFCANCTRIRLTSTGRGVNKIKLTGGEPTLRRDIIEIIQRIRKHITGNISITAADRLKADGPLGLLKIGSQLKDPDVSAGVRVLLSVARGFTAGRKDK